MAGRPPAAHGRAPGRNVRISEERWTRFGEIAGPAQRSAVLNAFIAWYTGEPGAALPARPEPEPEEEAPVHEPQTPPPPEPDSGSPSPAPADDARPSSLAARMEEVVRVFAQGFPALRTALPAGHGETEDAEPDPPDEQAARGVLVAAVAAAAHELSANLASVVITAFLDVVSEIDAGTAQWNAHLRRVLAAAEELLDQADVEVTG